MIRLGEITEENWVEAAGLELEEEQKRYVASPLGILARGYVFRDSRARVFTVEEDGRVDFPRLSESLKLLRGWMG